MAVQSVQYACFESHWKGNLVFRGHHRVVRFHSTFNRTKLSRIYHRFSVPDVFRTWCPIFVLLIVGLHPLQKFPSEAVTAGSHQNEAPSAQIPVCVLSAEIRDSQGTRPSRRNARQVCHFCQPMQKIFLIPLCWRCSPFRLEQAVAVFVCRCKVSVRELRKPYWCTECQIGFTLKGNLTKHIQRGLCLRNKKVGRFIFTSVLPLFRFCLSRHKSSCGLTFGHFFPGDNELRGSVAEDGQSCSGQGQSKQTGNFWRKFDVEIILPAVCSKSVSWFGSAVNPDLCLTFLQLEKIIALEEGWEKAQQVMSTFRENSMVEVELLNEQTVESLDEHLVEEVVDHQMSGVEGEELILEQQEVLTGFRFYKRQMLGHILTHFSWSANKLLGPPVDRTLKRATPIVVTVWWTRACFYDTLSDAHKPRGVSVCLHCLVFLLKGISL